MYESIIFVDFENMQQINDDIITPESKVIIFVGLNQEKKAVAATKELLKKVASIELIKVNGQGPNALDFFITFYLGVYIDRIITVKETNITICSNDTGYDPLITHLKNNGILIQRIPFQKKTVNTEIINIVNTDNDSNLNKIWTHFKKKRKTGRPKKVKTLATYINALFSGSIPPEEMIVMMKESGYIEITNESVTFKI
jgi:hypothetical protein